MGQTLLVCARDQRRLRGDVAGSGACSSPTSIQFGIAMTGIVRRGVLRAAAARGRRTRRACSPRSIRRRSRMLPDFGELAARRSPSSSSRSPSSGGRSWYPGAEPGGGSYIAQRMLAAQDRERDALGGTLFFNVAHYALRPWPWIIVALRSMLVFPHARRHRARACRTSTASLLGNDMAYPAMLTLPAARAARPHGRRTARRLRLDDLDAPQLGHVVSRPRLLSPLHAARRDRDATTCSSAALIDRRC